MFVYPILMLGDNFFTIHCPDDPKFGTSVHQHMANDVSTIPCQVGLKIFKTNSKKLKFWHIFVKHVPKSSLQSRKGSYGEMPQHIWTSEHHFKPCRKLLHYSKSVVNRSLTKSSEFHKKIKKPQIPLKPSPMASMCQLMSMKNNIREETIFARQSSM